MAELILWFMRWLNKCHVKLTKDDSSSNPEGFEGLTPVITEKDPQKHYADNSVKALEVALEDDRITNIAITGSYGSGKSSFLRTFEHHHKWFHYINISLATFIKVENEDKQLIERSILQQLLYKVENNTIPQSQYNKLRKIYFYKSLIPILVFLIWVITYIVIFHVDIAKKILLFQNIDIPNICYSIFGGDICNSLVLIGFLATSLAIVWWAYKYLSSYRITKFTSKGIDVTKVSQEDKESFLNKNLDEIMYFFEATQYNVVVIEDLDRSENPEVFIKLREINELINKSNQIGRTVNFVYAIKDDMFQNETRTKFFDLMIPIIPYLSRHNSYAKLKDKFSDFLSKIDSAEKDRFERLLKVISKYVSDMRLLLNILNEFKIYVQKVAHNGNYTKLLAMITYKNMLPIDFAQAHHNKSLLATVFNNKSGYINEATSGYEDDIEKIKQQLVEHNSNKDWLKDITELKKLYILEILSKCQYTYFYADGEQLNLQKQNIEQIFEKTQESKAINNSSNQQLFKSFTELENKVHENSYSDREALITGEAEKYNQELKERIEKIEKKKSEIRNHTIKELLTIDVVSNKFKEESWIKEDESGVQESSTQLLRYFIREGYIDEHYHTYISYFHKGDFTEQDNKFILAVYDHDAQLSDEALQEPQKVIDELELRYFNQPAILNISLIDELMNYEEAEDKRNKVFSLLITKDTSQFLEEYLFSSQVKNKDKFIQLLIARDTLFWEKIVKSDKSDKKKDEYLALLIHAIDVESLENLNQTGTLEEYIDNKPDFIKYCTSNGFDVVKIESLLEQLNIELHKVNFISRDNPYSEIVYRNNHYKLKPEMINNVIEYATNKKINSEIKEKLTKSNYTTLKKEFGSLEETESLFKYIDDDIVSYVKTALLKPEDNTQESATTVIELLNNTDIDEDLRLKIIQKQEVRITEISTVESKSLWAALLDNNSIEPTWNNILAFYEEEEWEEPEDE